MMASFRWASHIKAGATPAFFAVAIVLATLFGLFLPRGQTGEVPSSEPAVTSGASVGLGITYLPVSRPVEAYCGLGVDYGALVTDVVPGSPAELAGVKVGDVILSFNGTRLDEDTPLLGMMMACPAGDTVTLEVWRVDNTIVVNLLHTDNG